MRNDIIQTLIQSSNDARVLDIIRKIGPINQAKIAKELGLHPATILRITNSLLEKELIVEIGKIEASAKGGRRASLIDLNTYGGFAIGVDLSGEDVVSVLVDLAGNVVSEVRKSFSRNEGMKKIVEKMEDTIEELLSSNIAPKERLLGIGVSMPGKVDSKQGISHYAIHFEGWNNVPIVEILETKFQLPVYLEHDIRSMAFGEMWFGRDCQNMICLGFRRGIGLATLINGELYRGHNEFAGDVGHIEVEQNGPLCTCGRRGCLEAIVSEDNIISKYRNYLNKEQVNIQTVYEGMKNDEPKAVELVKETADYIGKALANLERIFDPERIVIGGNCIATSQEFLEFTSESFQKNRPNYVDSSLNIDTTYLGDNCSAIGVASILISRLFKPKEANSF